MGENEKLLNADERATLAQFAGDSTLDAQRAFALLVLDDGKSQSQSADESGLTVGQVKYIRAKFLKKRLDAFAGVVSVAAETAAAVDTQRAAAVDTQRAAAVDTQRMEELVGELDGLVSELKSTVPKEGTSPYSPLHMVTMLRDNLHKLAPEVQLGILESFEGMTIDDLKDIDTWKGLAYMMSYSARFQAEQVKERMNEQLPNPLKPDTVIGFMKQNIDRFTPEIAKDLFNNFQGTSKEDWLDPDTWKGMFYMVNYSLQFQAEQLKQRLSGDSTDEEA
ncbi:MAG: hypothetical protein GY943_00485 [Chloroflexi bacterium]|nr:hypothetical protein [Chloroflexota bacterium]